MEIINNNIENMDLIYIYEALNYTLLNTNDLFILRNYISGNFEVDASYKEYYDTYINQNYGLIKLLYNNYRKEWQNKEHGKNLPKKIKLLLKVWDLVYKDLSNYLESRGMIGRNILDSLKILDQIDVLLTDYNNENKFNLERSRINGRG